MARYSARRISAAGRRLLVYVCMYVCRPDNGASRLFGLERRRRIEAEAEHVRRFKHGREREHGREYVRLRRERAMRAQAQR